MQEGRIYGEIIGYCLSALPISVGFVVGVFFGWGIGLFVGFMACLFAVVVGSIIIDSDGEFLDSDDLGDGFVVGLVFPGVPIFMYSSLVAIGFSGFWATVGAIIYFISIFLVSYVLEKLLNVNDDLLGALLLIMVLAPVVLFLLIGFLLVLWYLLYLFVYVFPVIPEICRKFAHLLAVFLEVVLPYIRNAKARSNIIKNINSLKEMEAKCTDIIARAPLGKLFLDPVAESIIWPIIMAIIISILKKLFK